LVNLSLSLYVQSGIKYLLTQGDTFVSARFATLEDQGMYALSANYGGLIARMLLRPIEDSSRNLFASLCHSSQEAKKEKTDDKTTNDDAALPQLKQASSILQSVLRFYCIVSLLAVAIGPTAAPLLLRLVAGSRWSDSGAGEVLATYCYSIPLLAINGVSEAFVAAVASAPELRRQSLWMGAFSIGFAASTWVFLSVLQMGAKGLVLANCVNMGLRIIFNLEFAARYFKNERVGFAVTDLLPGALAVAFTAVVGSAVRATEGALSRYGLLGEILRVGTLAGLLVLLV
jgi:oligosaccharide translocation protein RFT1